MISFQEELIVILLKRQIFPNVGSEIHGHEAIYRSLLVDPNLAELARAGLAKLITNK